MHTTLPSRNSRSQHSCRADFKRFLPVSVHFMRSGEQDVGRDSGKKLDHEAFDLISSRSLDEALLSSMSTMSQHARESLGWLRHAFNDPDDFSASAIGRMVSKEYGRHERPHTDRHMWRSPAASPASSPTAQQAAAAAAAASTAASSTSGNGLPGPQTATAQKGTGWSWGFGGPVSSSSETEVYHSPPSGPGFLLQQQKRND